MLSLHPSEPLSLRQSSSYSNVSDIANVGIAVAFALRTHYGNGSRDNPCKNLPISNGPVKPPANPEQQFARKKHLKPWQRVQLESPEIHFPVRHERNLLSVGFKTPGQTL